MTACSCVIVMVQHLAMIAETKKIVYFRAPHRCLEDRRILEAAEALVELSEALTCNLYVNPIAARALQTENKIK